MHNSAISTTILVVNFNTSDFIGLMLKAFYKLTVTPYKVLICDNGSRNREILKLVKIAKDYDSVDLFFRNQSAPGSVGHGEALDFLVDKVNTPYFVIMDADATILYPRWDEILIRKLIGRYKLIGTPPVKTGGKRADFPCVYTTMFDTKTFQSLNCFFRPVSGQEGMGKDTGYSLREKYLNNDFKAALLVVKNTRYSRNGPFGNIPCAEYYLEEDSRVIFSSHFSRGSSGGVAKYKNELIYRIPILSKFIKRYVGRRDKKRWIKRAYNVVDRYEGI